MTYVLLLISTMFGSGKDKNMLTRTFGRYPQRMKMIKWAKSEIYHIFLAKYMWMVKVTLVMTFLCGFLLTASYVRYSPIVNTTHRHLNTTRLIPINDIINEDTRSQDSSPLLIYNPQEGNNFSVLINNPRICGDVHRLNFVVYVHSGANRFKQRHVLRTTWLNDKFLGSRGMRRVFLLGRHVGEDAENIQDLIQAESEVYGDIIQGDYHDTYRNISLKALMGMKWLSNNCRHAKMIIKFDDDLVVDFVKLLEVLSKYENYNRTFVCTVFRRNPILRDPKSCMKWCVDPKVLPGRKTFPTHCSGPLFTMSGDLPALLYNAAIETPFLWVDDAYLTGLLPESIPGVIYKADRPRTWNHFKTSLSILSAWSDYWEQLLNIKSSNGTTNFKKVHT